MSCCEADQHLQVLRQLLMKYRWDDAYQYAKTYCDPVPAGAIQIFWGDVPFRYEESR